MKNEDELVIKRFIDLSTQADRKGYTLYGDFLNMNEISLLQEKKADYSSAFSLYGGYGFAERQMVSFQPDAFYLSKLTIEDQQKDYPIDCLRFYPAASKFADKLTHRDVLGALMNLGIERKKIGDILLKDMDIYIFCHSNISSIILSDLSKIKHTIVRGEKVSFQELNILPEFDEKTGFVASNRLDAFIACICNVSRSTSAELILGEKIFINGKLITNHNQKLNPHDIISIRGFGKVQFEDFLNTTKKGRLRIGYKIYK